MATKKDLIAQLMKALTHEEAEELVRRVVKLTETPEIDWTRERGACPQCGHEGPVDPDFGVMVKRGVRRAQSWCKRCRAGKNYHRAPRKNRVRYEVRVHGFARFTSGTLFVLRS